VSNVIICFFNASVIFDKGYELVVSPLRLTRYLKTDVAIPLSARKEVFSPETRKNADVARMTYLNIAGDRRGLSNTESILRTIDDTSHMSVQCLIY